MSSAGASLRDRSGYACGAAVGISAEEEMDGRAIGLTITILTLDSFDVVEAIQSSIDLDFLDGGASIIDFDDLRRRMPDHIANLIERHVGLEQRCNPGSPRTMRGDVLGEAVGFAAALDHIAPIVDPEGTVRSWPLALSSLAPFVLQNPGILPRSP